MGIGLDRRPQSFENPLLALRSPYSQSWSIATSGLTGTLTLGAAIPRAPIAELPLPPAVSVLSPVAPFASAVGGKPAVYDSAWGFDDDPTVCWEVSPMTDLGCVPTVFDTGTPSMEFSHGFPGPGPPANRAFSPGATVSAWVSPKAPAPFWTFITGLTSSRDLVLVEGNRGRSVLAGIQAFYAFKITYDAVRGKLYLTPSTSRSLANGLPSGEFSKASALCIDEYHAATRANLETPKSDNHDLRSVQRVVAFHLRAFGTLSLTTDRRLAQIRVPVTDERPFQRAIASAVAAGRLMLRFADTVTRSHTRAGYRRGLAIFNTRVTAAGRGWVRGMAKLGVSGCN